MLRRVKLAHKHKQSQNDVDAELIDDELLDNELLDVLQLGEPNSCKDRRRGGCKYDTAYESAVYCCSNELSTLSRHLARALPAVQMTAA